jgi:hypothetical protein
VHRHHSDAGTTVAKRDTSHLWPVEREQTWYVACSRTFSRSGLLVGDPGIAGICPHPPRSAATGGSIDRASSPERRPTATEQALAALPRGALIVTDVPFVAYLTAGRRTLILPQAREFLTHDPNRAFAKEVLDWGQILASRGGYAFFDRSRSFGIATPDDLGNEVPLELISQTGTESLYRISPTR